MRKLFKNFAKIILIIYILRIAYGVIAEIPVLFSDTDFRLSGKAENLCGIEIDLQERKETLKNTPSSIKGMSQYDCIQMGLARDGNGDADLDGLTDKEEIEIYGTDPLKSSTAGDLYLDGYKIAQNMDPFRYYVYDEKFQFLGNKCNEVILGRSAAINRKAVVYSLTLETEIKGYKNFKAYHIYNYDGRIKIDLEALSLMDKNIMVCITRSYTEPVIAEYTIQDNIMEIEYDFDWHNSYQIFLLKKNAIYNPKIAERSITDTEEVPAIVFYSIWGNALFNWKPVILCTSDEIIPYIEKIYGSEPQYHILSKPVFRLIEKSLNILLPDLNYDLETENKEDIAWPSKIQEFILFTNTENTKKICEYETPNAYEFRTFEKIDIKEETFSFRNFNTEFSPNGTCAGITRFTAALHNTGKSKENGSFISNNKILQWDLMKDEENKTLLDPSLSDYTLSKSALRKIRWHRTLYMKKLKSYEQEFFKMSADLWKEANESVDFGNHCLNAGEYYDAAVREDVLDLLCDGKMVECYIYTGNGSGHALIIYDYEMLWFNNDCIYFYVYDCNFGTSKMKTWSTNGNMMYSYDPLLTSYKADSNVKEGEMYGIMFFDAEGNILE